jgi:hypothetical protein
LFADQKNIMKTIKITRDNEYRLIALNQEDQAYLAQWQKRIRELEPGEIMTAHLDAQASHALNAWHHILIGAVFKAQERFTKVDAFREFLYIMSGYATEVKIKRKIVRIAESWSFDTLPNDFDRQDVHNKVVMAMHDEDVLFAIWPHLKPAARMEMMLTTIAEAEAKREQHKAAKAMRMAARAQRQPVSARPVAAQMPELEAA